MDLKTIKYDPNKHHRRSIRLPEYDYSQPGLDFLTLCTYRRECMFGAIHDGRMKCNPLGEIVREEWALSGQIRREIELRPDEFILMPNHLHAIVRIIDPVVGVDGIRPDGIILPDGFIPGEEGARRAPQPSPPSSPPSSPQPLRREGRTLGSFVAGFNSSVTTRARRELGLQPVWQRNYYEHVIRNEAAYARILAYIRTNPLRWTDDQLYPDAPPNRFNQEYE